MSSPSFSDIRIAVVIPCYRVTQHILQVIERIGPEVAEIFVVDDACPDHSGQFVLDHQRDPRVTVLFNPENRGVGGAVMRGYREAHAKGYDCVVKIDGDGQMDPGLLPAFVAPILSGDADYTKGNRFYNPEDVRAMPSLRLFGNAVLSFMNKASSGYWSTFDPTNGYTAISGEVIGHLPLQKISERYFFETDMLFRLGTIGAVVCDIPMKAVYADEVSGLHINKILGPFLRGHARNFCKRIIYSYYLRDFSAASIELVLGLPLLLWGAGFGAYAWWESIRAGVPATSGTVMLSALPIITGTQLLLSFLQFDVASQPTTALHPRLQRKRPTPPEETPSAPAPLP